MMRPVTPESLQMRKSPQRPLSRSGKHDAKPFPIFVPRLPSPISTVQAPNGQILEIGSNLKNWKGILHPCPPQETFFPQENSAPKKIVSPDRAQEFKPFIDASLKRSYESPKQAIPGLQFSYRAYDGSPIYIVPKNLYNETAALFTKGQYGVDTESDSKTGDLRIIQIYDGTSTYIFGADALNNTVQIGLPKFFRSKDRIKIGVDIEADVRKIVEYMSKNKKYRPEDRFAKPYHVSGIMDVQNIAMTMGETSFSLDYLGKKYVEGFKGNPSNLGSYLKPTPQQYIYAANDAVVSLQIYKALTKSYMTNSQ